MKFPTVSSSVLLNVAALALASTSLQAQEAAPSRFHALLNLEFADQYVTPRGMIVHDDGLAFQPLLLGFLNVHQSESFLSDVTLVGGFWNDFSTRGVSEHPPFGSKPKTHWVEIDPIAGVSLGLGKQVRLDVTYTAFLMEVLDIPTSQHLEVKLSLDDSPWLHAFALHPHLIFWQELRGKATAARVPYSVFLGESGPDSSFYFDLGVAPSYTFAGPDIKVEAPCRILMPDSDFYGEYYGSPSFVALCELGLKASVPLRFVQEGYGNWSFHAGFKYMRFIDDNLAGMQEFNAPGESKRDALQVYCGLSVFF
jgi:hypothetical protein